jgi:hypothetical protein
VIVCRLQKCACEEWRDLFPSAPLLASIPAERIAFRPVRIIEDRQTVLPFDEGVWFRVPFRIGSTALVMKKQ